MACNSFMGLFARIGNSVKPLHHLAFVRLRNLFSNHSNFGRPHYKYCIVNAFDQAKKLGHKKMSIIEFGVAGGKGLVCIEKLCEQQKKVFGIDFEIYGFDREGGLPEPEDYRDVPYNWGGGFFKMDRKKLESQLKYSRLVLGDVEKTSKTFFDTYKPAPVGCLMFDLDYYSSTKAAFQIFDHPNEDYYLPRIHCYFDDLNSIEDVGERLAIKEFNQENSDRKIGNKLDVHIMREIFGWRLFEYHQFKHKDYARRLSQNEQLPL